MFLLDFITNEHRVMHYSRSKHLHLDENSHQIVSCLVGG